MSSSGWQDWVRRNLPKHLNEHGDLSPPWAKFPHYERYTIGWRMGEGETWMGMWYHFCESLPSKQELEAYLRRHPVAPENWGDIIFGVLCPDWDSPITAEAYELLKSHGILASDAGFVNWLKQGVSRALPFEGESTPAHAAQYRTRVFSFWARVHSELDMRKEYEIPSAPESWSTAFPERPPFERGWDCLAFMLLEGDPVPPWRLGLECREADYSAQDSAEYLDAYALWAQATFDDSALLVHYLEHYEASEEWRAWLREQVSVLF